MTPLLAADPDQLERLIATVLAAEERPLTAEEVAQVLVYSLLTGERPVRGH